MITDSGVFKRIKPPRSKKYLNIPLYIGWLCICGLFFVAFQYSLFEPIDILFSDLLFRLVEEQKAPKSFEESPIVIITVGNQSLNEQTHKSFPLHRENFVQLIEILKYTQINAFDYFFTNPVMDPPHIDYIQEWVEQFEENIPKSRIYDLAGLTQDYTLALSSLAYRNCIYSSGIETEEGYTSVHVVGDYLLPKFVKIFKEHGKEFKYDLNNPLDWAPEEEDYLRFLAYVEKEFFLSWESYYKELQGQPQFQNWLKWLIKEDPANPKLLVMELEKHWKYYQKALKSASQPDGIDIKFDIETICKLVISEVAADYILETYEKLKPKIPFFEYTNQYIRNLSNNFMARSSDFVDFDLFLRMKLIRKKMGLADGNWNSINLTHPMFPILPLIECALPTFAMTYREKDGTHRNYPLVRRVWLKDNFYLCSNLALSAYLQIFQMDTSALEYYPNEIRVPKLNLSIPINKEGASKILWRGDSLNDFPKVELVEVITEYQKAQDKEAYCKKWVGKICFIGETNAGSSDRGSTPLDPYYPMVGCHAHFMQQILERRFIRDATTPENMFFLFLIFLFCLIGLSFESWRVNILSITILLFVLLPTFVGLYYFSNTIYAVTYSIFGSIALALVTFLYRYITIGRSQRAIRHMFTTMVSPDILNYMEKNPDAFSLKGEAKYVSVLFSDIAGFTTISEKMHPSVLVELLNYYLTAMTDIIISYHGYIDKYEGDAIMAVWGVPISSENHAVDCCYSALDQITKLNEIQGEIKRRFGVELKIRIGANSGSVSAGCMGSEKKKMSYTIIGDAVNLGARLESANKNYKTTILIGKNTYENAKSQIVVRPIDRLIVVGKTEPVTVYELLGKKGAFSKEQENVFSLFWNALECYWKQEWDQAEKHLKEYLTYHPQDYPSQIYLERLQHYRLSPPGDAWKGEFKLDSK